MRNRNSWFLAFIAWTMALSLCFIAGVMLVDFIVGIAAMFGM